MRFRQTDLPGVVIVEPQVFRDARGFFLETYHQQKYAGGGIDAVFVQDNHSRSARGTVRGLHAQLQRPQGKLVRVIEGEIYDIAVDIRRGSPSFSEWVGVWLSAENFRQIYIPPGFAHGFCVTSEIAQVEYKCTDFYDPASEISIQWDDPDLDIDWPSDIRLMPVLSRKDMAARPLRELMDMLPYLEEK
ncbi:MAG: dTDP-4-dehydrorhamnose 3,5-epimerase [Acidobacteria bacterium]|nr:dTDP-4-dehydrorhamnose 3,5-epimerase [Acidobacteriota bacterium]